MKMMNRLLFTVMLICSAMSVQVVAHETGAAHTHTEQAVAETEAVTEAAAEQKNTAALEKARQVRPELPATGNLVKVTMTLCLVLGLIFAIAWAFKRFGGIQPGGGQGPIKLVGQMPVGVKERIMLIEVGGEQVLVGYSQSGFETLHVMQEKVESETAKETAGFANVLKLAMGKAE